MSSPSPSTVKKDDVDLKGKDARANRSDEDDDNDPNTAKNFPQQLMEILSDESNSDAITWLPHGKAFIITSRKVFSEKVMPKYFSRKSMYSSFTRKLNRWNFVRVSSGPELGAYYHEFFLRDKPHLAARMFCRTGASAKFAGSSGIDDASSAQQTQAETQSSTHTHMGHGIGLRPNAASQVHPLLGAANSSIHQHHEMALPVANRLGNNDWLLQKILEEEEQYAEAKLKAWQQINTLNRQLHQQQQQQEDVAITNRLMLQAAIAASHAAVSNDSALRSLLPPVVASTTSNTNQLLLNNPLALQLAQARLIQSMQRGGSGDVVGNDDKNRKQGQKNPGKGGPHNSRASAA